MHWTLTVVSLREIGIECYDSMAGSGAGSGREVLENLMHWLQDEVDHKKKSVLDDIEWERVYVPCSFGCNHHHITL